MFKQFLLKKLIASQLKSLPAEQRALIEKLIDEKPELLMKLAQEVQGMVQNGKSQQDAMMTVAQKYKDELKGFLGA